MTRVLITIDTELSLALHQQGVAIEDNLQSSIFGRTQAGSFGILHQMDVLDAHGCTGVFFVDPLCALVYGLEPVARTVAPILARGHEVQLHIHTEWLAFAPANPLGERTGRNIGDFTLEDQVALLGLARDLLVEAGAPAPIAFRAGNYGANDDTLTALARLGLRFDSSFNPAYRDAGCDIALRPEQTGLVPRGGVTEVPVSGLFALPGRIRHAQVCALSIWEMRAALAHAARIGQSCFTIVSHSFELLSRDRQRPNLSVIDRFRAMAEMIARHPGLESAGFRDMAEEETLSLARLGPNPVRTACRMAAQAVAALRYERA